MNPLTLPETLTLENLSREIYSQVCSKESGADSTDIKKMFINFVKFSCGKESSDDKLRRYINIISEKIILNQDNPKWMETEMDKYNVILDEEDKEHDALIEKLSSSTKSLSLALKNFKNSSTPLIQSCNLTDIADSLINLKSLPKDIVQYFVSSAQIRKSLIEIRNSPLSEDQIEILDSIELDYNNSINTQNHIILSDLAEKIFNLKSKESFDYAKIDELLLSYKELSLTLEEEKVLYKMHVMYNRIK